MGRGLDLPLCQQVGVWASEYWGRKDSNSNNVHTYVLGRPDYRGCVCMCVCLVLNDATLLTWCKIAAHTTAVGLGISL